MGISIGDKVLITTSQWFFAPDGQNYMAVHGTVHAIKTDACNFGEAIGETGDGEQFRQVMRATRIYNADQKGQGDG